MADDLTPQARNARAGTRFMIGGFVIAALGELSTFFIEFEYDLAVQIILLVLMVALFYFTVKAR